jgi:NTE family protein
MPFRRRRPRTAFVLSGGGSQGAQQVGMLKALAEHGVRPDLLVGASAGALNAAWVATRGWPSSVEGLEELWLSLKRSDVFPLDVPALVGAVFGRRNHLLSPHGLRRIIEDNLTVQRFEDTAIPLRVVITEALSGEERVVGEGDLADVLLASASIPGIFPPVAISGSYYVDGGVAENTPIEVAVKEGAKEVYVLATSYGCRPDSLPSSALSMFLHALNLLVNRGLRVEIERWSKKARIHVLPSVCNNEHMALEFNETKRLIDEAFERSRAFLASLEGEAGGGDGPEAHRRLPAADA